MRQARRAHMQQARRAHGEMRAQGERARHTSDEACAEHRRGAGARERTARAGEACEEEPPERAWAGRTAAKHGGKTRPRAAMRLAGAAAASEPAPKHREATWGRRAAVTECAAMTVQYPWAWAALNRTHERGVAGGRECGPSVAHSRGRGSERNGDDVERSRRPRLPPVAIHPCDHTDQTSSGAYHHVLPCGHVATQMRGIPKRLGSKAASRIPRRESIACNTMGWTNLPGRSHSRFCPPGLAHDHARWTDPYRIVLNKEATNRPWQNPTHRPEAGQDPPAHAAKRSHTVSAQTETSAGAQQARLGENASKPAREWLYEPRATSDAAAADVAWLPVM